MQRHYSKRRPESEGISGGLQFGILECRYFPKPTKQRRFFELIYIKKGEGLCFAGDAITQFLPGDLFFFSDITSHYLQSASQFYKAAFPLRSGATYLRFNEGVLPSDYASLFDCANISRVISNSQRGIRWRSENIDREIIHEIELMEQLPGLERYIQLLKVLNKLGEMLNSGEMIANRRSDESLQSYDGAYLQVVEFISHNFQRNITLDELANYTSMNRTALCRHFRSHANRSIFEFLQEFRISYVMKMLETTSLPIADIALGAGFNNLTNFTIQFRKSAGITPSEYRCKFISERKAIEEGVTTE